MIKINRQTDYAIRVVLALSRAISNTRMATAKIQEEMQIPHAFLQRIVANLARAGIIHTYPGREGGIQLARPAGEITLKDVIEAVEGPILVSECLLAHDLCPLNAPCPVRCYWRELQEKVKADLEAVNFMKLAGSEA